MTLLELLVKELPGRGGWPSNAVYAYQSLYSGKVYFLDSSHEYTGEENGHDKWHFEVTTDRGTSNKVTRQQYEEALAASQRPVWDGEGLPPVGVECEIYNCGEWKPVKIKFVGDEWVVTDRADLGHEVVYCLTEKPERFRPIRNELELKREEATIAMRVKWLQRACEINSNGTLKSIYEVIYDQIAEGEIPGVKLAGGGE